MAKQVAVQFNQLVLLPGTRQRVLRYSLHGIRDIIKFAGLVCRETGYGYLRGARWCRNRKYTFPWARERDICAVLVCAGAGFHIYHGTTG